MHYLVKMVHLMVIHSEVEMAVELVVKLEQQWDQMLVAQWEDEMVQMLGSWTGFRWGFQWERW